MLWSKAILYVLRSWDFPTHLVVIGIVFHWHNGFLDGLVSPFIFVRGCFCVRDEMYLIFYMLIVVLVLEHALVLVVGCGYRLYWGVGIGF